MKSSKLSRPRKDLTGMQSGRLTVLRPVENRAGEWYWLCRCECGETTIVRGSRLTVHDTRSCGCLARETARNKVKTHGLSRSPEYISWGAMIQRCNNPKAHAFENYGGRGVKVCERWRWSFVAFLEDMGPRPTDRHELDRIDTNGDYEPSNCRWVLPVVNIRNRRCTVKLTYAGETLPLGKWSERIGIPQSVIAQRIRAGWSIARALTQPRRIC